MNDPHLDPHLDPFRPQRRPARNLSAPHLRALRKELLIVRAEVERVELAESYADLRQTITHFSWLKFLVPTIAKSRGGAFGSTLGPMLGRLMKQYPLVGSLVSLVLAKPLREGVASAAKPLLKWAGIGLTAWEAYRRWVRVRQQVRQQPDAAAARAAGDSGR
jgi:hypothetical protein